MDLSAEQSVLAAMLAGGGVVIDEVTAALSEWHFADPVSREIFVAARTFRSVAGGVLTADALRDLARDDGADAGSASLAVETFEALLVSGPDPSGAAVAARWAASRVRADAERRATTAALADASEIVSGRVTDAEGVTWAGPLDARTWAQARFAEVEAECGVLESQGGLVTGTGGEAREILDTYAAAHAVVMRGEPDRRPRFGLESIDDVIGGCSPGELVIIGGPQGAGKAQPLDAQVLTPSGFRNMGDLKVGDPVIDPEGQPSEVTGIFPQGVSDIFRVTFSDGSSCECTTDHLWKVSQYKVSKLNGKRVRRHEDVVVPTSELIDHRSSAPYLDVSPDLGSGASLPIDPYVLGVLLGDGYIGSGPPQLCSMDQEIIDNVRVRLPDSMKMVKTNNTRGLASNYILSLDNRSWEKSACVNGCPKSVVGRNLCHNCFEHARKAGTLEGYPVRGWRPNPISQSLDELLLRVSKSLKFVPEIYFNASVEDRLSLLRGLMDTDGNVDQRRGSVHFGFCSRALRDGVVWIARSLGLRVTTNGEGAEHKYWSKSKGCYVKAAVRYRGTISSRGARPMPSLFLLSRKAVLQRATSARFSERGGRRIKSVTFVRRDEAQCIAVSAPSRLYITNDFVVTHNSQTLVHLAHHAVTQQGLNVFFATSETVRSVVRNRMVARHSRSPQMEGARTLAEAPEGLDSGAIKRGLLPVPQLQLLRSTVLDMCESDCGYGALHLAQVPYGSTMASVAALAASVDRQFPIDIIIIDYLALLNSDRRYSESRNELSRVVVEAKRVATTFRRGHGIPVVSPWQISRAAQEELARSGTVELRGLAETAEIERSADLVIFTLPDGARERHRYQNIRLLIGKQRDGQIRTGDDSLSLRMDYATCMLSDRAGASDSFGNGSGATSALDGLVPSGWGDWA